MISEKLYERACAVIPGGVNSPVRAFKSVHRDTPIFIKHACGALLTDIEDKQYIDYIGSWGPMILGHSYAPLIQKIRESLDHGTSFGLPTELEVDLAEIICAIVPSMDMVRLTVSGTEATMSALRLARAYTKRNKVLKFAGCYHGHSDSLLCGEVGSGMLTNQHQDANGIPQETILNTTTVDFGDLVAVEKHLQTHEYAALILEPIPANMGLIIPQKGFLHRLRELCTKFGTLLIFDEVISGFRLALGGAKELFDIRADLTTFGKIIGGGFPVGAFGGRREIMTHIAPSGSVYHAGTLSGNPVACTAGIFMLKELSQKRETLYTDLEKKTCFLAEEAQKLAKSHQIPVCISQMGSLFTCFFTNLSSVNNLNDAKTCNLDHYARYFNAMLDQGVLTPMSQFEAHFVSAAHTDDELSKTLLAMDKAFFEVAHV
ncbi:MAG: glutamate-1-semialdehyde 2,1-aminomutase [Brevinema sp.]